MIIFIFIETDDKEIKLKYDTIMKVEYRLLRFMFLTCPILLIL